MQDNLCIIGFTLIIHIQNKTFYCRFKTQNKNLAPMLEKQKWKSCSSQPTPRAAKLHSPKPPSMFVEPQEKIPSMCHLLHSHISFSSNASLLLAYGYTIIQYFSWDLVIYEPPSLQHSTRSCDLIFGDVASCILSSY